MSDDLERAAYLVALEEASERRERARVTYEEAAQVAQELLVAAHALDGISISALARAAKLSRTRVYQILGLLPARAGK